MLTLPIQLGKKYRTRDGHVVIPLGHTNGVIRYQHPTLNIRCVYSSNGRLKGSFSGGEDAPSDLVADAEEGHPHAALMLQYAQDAAETPEPWKLWEHSPPGDIWRPLKSSPSWWTEFNYRRKPKLKKVWLNVYPSSQEFSDAVSYHGYMYATKEIADHQSAGLVRIACIEVEIPDV